MSATPPKGVFAAVSTPVSEDFRPDAGRFLAHCEWLLANGCDGLAPLGTTSEANSLALADRLALIATMQKSGLPMDRLIIGTGSCALNEAIEVSRIALEAGAGGILMLPPFYYKAPTEDGLYAYFSHFAESLGATRPRIFLYHFPQMSAVPFTIPLVARLRAAFPGLFVGMKDSSGDFDNTRSFLEAFPGFQLYSGAETFLLDNLAAGGSGCISASTNITAPLAARAMACADTAEAVEWSDRAHAMRVLITAVHAVSGTKAALSAYRKDPAWARVVPPNVSIGPDEAAKLVRQLDEIWNLHELFD